MSIIYLIHNQVTGLNYVGQTSRDIHTRMRYHGYDADKGSGAKLHQSLRDYGWDKHVYGIIEETDTPDDRECYWIEYFDTLKNGLNSAPGGGAYPQMKGVSHPLYGVGHTDETRAKISANHADVSGSKNGRARKVMIYFGDGTTMECDCLKDWCRTHDYHYGAHYNRIVGSSCTYHKKPTQPHYKSNVVKIIRL